MGISPRLYVTVTRAGRSHRTSAGSSITSNSWGGNLHVLGQVLKRLFGIRRGTYLGWSKATPMRLPCRMDRTQPGLIAASGITLNERTYEYCLHDCRDWDS
jgi:hypothetical protein